MEKVDRFEVDLVLAAQRGDAASFALLIERHRSGMMAVAVAILGYCPDAEDVVQDAVVTALTKLGSLRDPSAAGPWLRAITRNGSRMKLRDRHLVLVPDVDPAVPSTELRPDEEIEKSALNNWIWGAIGELSAPLQEVVLLRHFTDVHTYEGVAAACRLPIGTVRSRLHSARRHLASALTRTAESAFPDRRAEQAEQRRDAEEVLQVALNGRFDEIVRERFAPDAHVIHGDGRVGGAELVVDGLDRDLDHGLSGELVNAAASPDVTAWEIRLIAPEGGSAGERVLWLHTQDGGKVSRMKLHNYSAASDRPARELRESAA